MSKTFSLAILLVFLCVLPARANNSAQCAKSRDDSAMLWKKMGAANARSIKAYRHFMKYGSATPDKPLFLLKNYHPIGRNWESSAHLWIERAAKPPSDGNSANREIGRRYHDPYQSRRKRKRKLGRQDDPRVVSRKPFEQFISRVQKDNRAKVTTVAHQGWGERRQPLYRIDVPPENNAVKPLRVVLFGKLHGDELVGREVAMKLVARALKSKRFRQRVHLTVFAELNVFDRRDAPGLKNLNRQFPPGTANETIDAVLASLGGEKINAFACIHSAPKDGFFVIRHKDDRGMSQRFLSALNNAALLDAPPDDPINGSYKLHALGAATSTHPGTSKAYMSARGIPYAYTFEAPRFLPLSQQVRGMDKLVQAFINTVAKHGKLD